MCNNKRTIIIDTRTHTFTPLHARTFTIVLGMYTTRTFPPLVDQAEKMHSLQHVRRLQHLSRQLIAARRPLALPPHANRAALTPPLPRRPFPCPCPFRSCRRGGPRGSHLAKGWPRQTTFGSFLPFTRSLARSLSRTYARKRSRTHQLDYVEWCGRGACCCD